MQRVCTWDIMGHKPRPWPVYCAYIAYILGYIGTIYGPWVLCYFRSSPHSECPFRGFYVETQGSGVQGQGRKVLSHKGPFRKFRALHVLNFAGQVGVLGSQMSRKKRVLVV